MNHLFSRLFLLGLLGLFMLAFLVLPLVFGSLRLATLRDVHLDNHLSLIQLVLVPVLLRDYSITLIKRLLAPHLDHDKLVLLESNSSSASVASSLSGYNSRPAMLVRKSTIYSRATASSLNVDTSHSHTSRQAPQLSPILFALLTAGSLVLLSLFAVSLYCCARCRRQNKTQRKGVNTPSEVEKGRVVPASRCLDAGRSSTGSGKGTGSPSALDFSPPSPTWRPTLPSLAHISSNSDGISNGLASGRGPILDAETIMQEREPGRRKVYGGGGWTYGPHTFGASAISAVSANPVPPHYRQSANTEQPSLSNTRAGINMPVVPPLPPRAPQIYRPPAYNRCSRIIPIRTGADRSRPVPNPAGGQPGSNQGDSVVSISTERTVSVPRIEIHLARETSAIQGTDARVETRTRQITRPKKPLASSSSLKPAASGSSLQRSSSTSSQSERPASGLGISTINLGADELTNPSTNSLTSPTMSDEDVRLAYRTSMVSVISTPNSTGDLEQQKSTKGSRDPVDNCRSTLKNKRISRFHSTRVSNQATGPKFTGSATKKYNSATPSILRTTATNTKSKPTSRGGLISLPEPSSGSELRNGAVSESGFVASSGPSRSASSKRSNSSKRRALGFGALDQRTRSELHDMRSLGSESFDSLIAYLEESIESEEASDSREAISSGSRRRESLTNHSIERKNSEMKESHKTHSRITREETERVDKDAYEAWVRSLGATPSELRLAHVDVNSNSVQEGRMSIRPGRKSRTENKNAKSNNPNMVEGGAREESVSGGPAPLSDRDTNVNTRRTRERSQRVTGIGAPQNAPQGKVGMHIRDLRARSASLKVQIQNVGIVSNGGTATSSGDLAPLTVSKAKNVEAGSSIAQTQTVLGQRNQMLEHHSESTLLSVGSQEAISGLPSFSVPSTATQLYAAFPSSEVSPSASLSQSSSVQSEATTSSVLSHPDLASKQQFTTSKTSLLPAVSSRTICASVSTSNSKAMASASYIARCAPSPRLKTSAVLEFLSPSPPSPSLPHHRLPTHSPGQRSHMSRLSVDSVNTLDSEESVVSMWGRRSAWIRESLTPRFNHLMAVLEGRFEERPLTPSTPMVSAGGGEAMLGR